MTWNIPAFDDRQDDMKRYASPALVESCLERGIFIQREDGRIFHGPYEIIPLKPLPA